MISTVPYHYTVCERISKKDCNLKVKLDSLNVCCTNYKKHGGVSYETHHICINIMLHIMKAKSFIFYKIDLY